MNSNGRIAFGAALIWLLVLSARADEDTLIRRGREVYLAEGCIHCHSQYIRPGTADEGRWGPPRSLQEFAKEKPPLLGSRRQGPDLQNVGARRTAEGLRLHLQAPRLLIPGSRMPSYARLFGPAAKGDGDALVAYLLSLDSADRNP